MAEIIARVEDDSCQYMYDDSQIINITISVKLNNIDYSGKSIVCSLVHIDDELTIKNFIVRKSGDSYCATIEHEIGPGQPILKFVKLTCTIKDVYYHSNTFELFKDIPAKYIPKKIDIEQAKLANSGNKIKHARKECDEYLKLMKNYMTILKINNRLNTRKIKKFTAKINSLIDDNVDGDVVCDFIEKLFKKIVKN